MAIFRGNTLVSGSTPVATVNRAGKVRPDGTSITINESGIISSTTYKPLPSDMLYNTKTFTTTGELCLYFLEQHSDLAVAGAAYVGKCRMEDSPTTDLAGEVFLRVFDGFILQLDLYSDNTIPNHWYAEYTGGTTCTWHCVQKRNFDHLNEGNANRIYQYIGDTTTQYTQGYWYKVDQTGYENLMIEQTTGTSLSNVDLDSRVFRAKVGTLTTSATWVFTYNGTAWSLNSTVVDVSEYGISYEGTPVNNDVITITYTAATFTVSQVNVQPETEVINSVASTSTDSALSANMGKELQDQITHLKGIGRFLSLWNASTGLAQTNPTVSPYTYKTGDYFIVGTIAGSGGTNYKPDGSTYTIGTASTVVETEDIDVGYTYYYDGSSWQLQAGGGGTVTDVQINGTSILDASGVGNIPLAGDNDAGVFKLGAGVGINATTGKIYAGEVSYESYTTAAWVTRTIFISKGTLENVLAGKGIQRTTVADTSSTTATIASVAQATDYTFSQSLTSLTLTAIVSSMYESAIYFTAGTNFALTLPSGTKVIGGTPTFVSGKSYVIGIKNGMVVIGVAE